MDDKSRRFGRSGELNFSARGAAASGARRLRDPRFAFDPRELAEFDLPRLSDSRPAGYLSVSKAKSSASTQATPLAAASVSAAPSGGALSDATSGALPPIFHSDPTKRPGGARVTSGTLAAVRDAYGIDDSKRQEVEDIASVILAKTYGQQQRGSSTGAAPKPASPRRASVTGTVPDEHSEKARGDDAAAQLAMTEVEELRTGEVGCDCMQTRKYTCCLGFSYRRRSDSVFSQAWSSMSY